MAEAGCDAAVLEDVKDALLLSSHTLSFSPGQLFNQVTGRLNGLGTTGVAQVVERNSVGKATPWLRSLTPALTPPGGALLRTIGGHAREVGSIAITVDGTRAVSGSADGTLKVWDVDQGTLIRELRGDRAFDGRGVYRDPLVLTPNGSCVVATRMDGHLVVWDLDTGSEVRDLGRGAGDISLATVPDGRVLAHMFPDCSLKEWNVANSWECRSRSFVSRGALVVDPSGRRFAMADGQQPEIRDLDTAGLLSTLEGHTYEVSSVAFTATGRKVVTGSWDGTVRVWESDTGGELLMLEGHVGWVQAVAITPDDGRVLSGSKDGTIAVWNIESGDLLSRFAANGGDVTALAVTPDGRRAVSGSRSGLLEVWDLDRAEMAPQPHPEGGSAVDDVAVSADGTTAVVMQRGRYDVWDVKRARTTQVLRDTSVTEQGLPKGPIGTRLKAEASPHAMALTPDGKCVVAGYLDGSFAIWQLERGRRIPFGERGRDNPAPIVITPDGTRALSGYSLGSKGIHVWDLATGGKVGFIDSKAGWLAGVTPDGGCVITLDSGRATTKLWDIETGGLLHKLEGSGPQLPEGYRSNHWVEKHRSPPTSADGKLALARETAIEIWSLPAPGHLRTLEGHTAAITGLVMSPDGCRLVSTSDDGTLKIWDLETGRQERSDPNGGGWIDSISDDGRRAVMRRTDGSITIRDLDVGALLSHYTPDSASTVCRMSPDGLIVLIGDVRGTVHLLHLENSDLTVPIVAPLSGRSNRLQLICPFCTATTLVDQRHLGRPLQCSECGGSMRVDVTVRGRTVLPSRRKRRRRR